ncbi:MAG: hypothetical protein JW827_04915 [Spirochaetes bacterium]|nr:hypothetical protein [Spirochaetota bacterium]
MIHIHSKYYHLKQKITQGEVISTRIVKRISPTRAIATIKGYNVVIEGDSLPAKDQEVQFTISGFNNKERIITLKNIRIPDQNMREDKLNEFITNQLAKHGIPVNHNTVKLSLLLYQTWGTLDIQVLKRLLPYLSYTNDISLLYALFKLDLSEEEIINLLKWFKNIAGLLRFLPLSFYSTIQKNKNPDNKGVNKKEIYRLLRYITQKGKVDIPVDEALSKSNIRLRDIVLRWRLYNLFHYESKNEFLFLFPLIIQKTVYPVSFRYRKKDSQQQGSIFYLKLEISVKEGMVIYSIEYIPDHSLDIIIESDNRILKERIEKEREALEKKLQSSTRVRVSLKCHGSGHDNTKLDVYI